MPKRKLSDLTSDEPHKLSSSREDRQTLKLQALRLEQKFQHGVIALTRALKTARGFERQKLGRREKTAKSQEGREKVLNRLEEEIKVLKDLDPTTVAQKYLFKQLIKTKRIAESAPFVKFQQSTKISVEGPRSTAEANVTARLYKSNPVQNVFPGIMDGIRSLLGVDSVTDNKGKDSGKKTPSTGEGFDAKNKEILKNQMRGQQDGEDAAKTKLRPVRDGADDDDDDDDSEESSEEVKRRKDVDMEDVEEVSDDGEDYAQFDARIASDSEGDDNMSDDDSDGGSNHANVKPKPSLNRDMSISLSPSPEDPDFDSDSNSPPPASKKPKAKTSNQKATSTTFLPSLTMGGYWSGSETEAEDIDGGAEEPPKRKNRMGQQARRALWEKKFGSRANHLKQQNNSRDNGWDVRRGATSGENGPRGKRGSGREFGNTTGRSQQGRDFTPRSGGGGHAGAPKKPQDDKPLHPSWEAARKAKEQKAGASFQGKKVVFD